MVMLMWRLLEGSPHVLALAGVQSVCRWSSQICAGPALRLSLRGSTGAHSNRPVVVRRPEGLYFPQVSAADFKRTTDGD